MKKRNRRILCMAVIFTISVSGCQKTPDKSSVASKADGLDEKFIADTLAAGEMREIDLPEHWSALEKKSNDRVIISADLDMGKLETGNLPVIEMKNHGMTQEELERFVKYFAKGEELYVPQADTKEVFEHVKERIEKKEGAYASPVMGSGLELKGALEEAIKLAPENPAEDEKAELKFRKKIEDAAGEAANGWIYKMGLEKEETGDAEVFFAADVGKDRLSHIQAESYDPETANFSRFSWKTGTDRYDQEEIQLSVRLNEFSPEMSVYQEDFRELLEQYLDVLGQQTFSVEEGQKQAEKILEDLGVPEMTALSVSRMLWFPEEKMPDVRYGQPDDFYWQADPEDAKAGYKYVFTRSFDGSLIQQSDENSGQQSDGSSVQRPGGISAQQSGGSSGKEAADAYTSPFPVETVSVTVTDEGVKAFSWTGMCEEEAVVAENVNLLPFDDIESRLFDQIYYYYMGKGQPEEDITKFHFEVISARLGYTYVTAFDEPENAWLVPAWIFEVMEGSGTGEDIRDFADFQVTINAMDGGTIV